MRPGSPSTLLLVLVLAVLLGTAPVAGVIATAQPTPAPTSDGYAATGGASFQSEPPVEGSTIELQLRPNGDAVWTLSLRYQLANRNATRAFEDLAARFEADEIDLRYLESMRTARVATSDYTGREMRFRNVERTSRVVEPDANRTVGVLELSLVWTRFARSEGAAVAVDDAFRTGPNATWFPRIGPDQTFVIRPPEGYGVDTAPTGSRDGVLRWEGPVTFQPDYLEIRYQQLATGSTSPPTTPGEPTDRSTLLLLGGLVGVGVVAAGVLLLSRREDDTDPGAVPSQGSDSDPGSVTENGPETDTTGPADTPTPAVEDEADEDAGGPDPSLLSDEERVEYLLEQNGGRMKQASIVDETGWSNAKVSQLLSGMDEDGRVDKLRIGRENLISLPDEDVGGFEE
jgi:hypothetical protein